MPTCPACQSPLTVPVAEHYQAQVRLSSADPEAVAPFAPPPFAPPPIERPIRIRISHSLSHSHSPSRTQAHARNEFAPLD